MLAWALYALVLLLFATYPWLDRLVRDAGRPDLALLAPFVVAPSLAALTASTVGAVLASRRPRHPVGWLLLALGLSMAFGGLTAGYLPYALIVRPGALPATDLLARIYSPSAEAALAALGFVLLLTPTGSAPSARWRRWGIAAAVVMALLLVAAAVAPGSLDARTLTVEGPVGSRAFGGALRVANQLALLAAILIILGGAASLVTRFRHARGVERQQLRWVTLAAALTGVAMLATGVLVAVGDLALAGWASVIGTVFLPLAAGAAILRYRLYDLDRIISRTLAYGLLTGPAGRRLRRRRPGARPAAGPRLQPGRGGGDPGRGGGVPADPPAGPGGGRPPLQPAPPRRGPDHRGVRRPAPRPGRPGHPDRRGAGGGRPDDAADPGVAVAAAPGRPGRPVSRAQWRCW